MRPVDVTQRGPAGRLRTAFTRKRGLVCQEIVELVTAYLDGALDHATRVRFETHLAGCDGCAAYLEELRAIVATVGAVQDEHLNPVYRQRLVDTFESWLIHTERDESALIADLRAGDREAFGDIVDEHTPALLRVARSYVSSDAIAEEVIQETWIALLCGIDRFEGRSSLKTWLFTVTTNIAKRRGVRDRRDRDAAMAAATIDSSRFHPARTPNAGTWKEPPIVFPTGPEGVVLGAELRSIVQRELDKLPERQRIVVTLRDMLDFDAAEVCSLLDISATNQRVLLHRGRAGIRQVVEDYVRSLAD
jgi:RNA polymerase sigma-70 factor (ECF subfamily)